jgi:hypothetical protein
LSVGVEVWVGGDPNVEEVDEVVHAVLGLSQGWEECFEECGFFEPVVRY